MSPSIFEKITAENNIYQAYKRALRGKNKYTRGAIIFSADETQNLQRLRKDLLAGTYKFDGYTRFKVYEPKERIIDAPGFKDKVVQLAVNNILKHVYFPSFIYDSYASIDRKGTHECVDRIQHFMRKAKWQWGTGVYIIKIDVKKFFYSIDRKILKSLLPKKIKCTRTLKLLNHIIDSADAIDPRGLPLGNTLSQLFANVYLNEVDHYCKRRLSLKYYVRYMDDMIIFVRNKNVAREVKEKICHYLNRTLDLVANKNKTKIFPMSQGINAVGFKIHPTHRLLRNGSKKRIKRKAKKMRSLIEKGCMTVEKAEQILNSWLGHAKHGNSYNFIQRLIERNDYICLREGVLRVNADKVKARGDTVAAL